MAEHKGGRRHMIHTRAWQHTMATALRRGTVLLVLLALGIFFSLSTDRFLQSNNLLNIAVQNSPVIVVAIGMTLVMLVGGIDLSVGSVAALSGAVAAGLVARSELPVAIGMLAGVVVGWGLGLVNGALVVYGKLPPFVATLAMLGVARGLTLGYTEGRPISVRTFPDFTFWGRDSIGPFPAPVVVAVIIIGLAWLLLTRTRFGLHIYAIGGNEETARLAGVPVNRVKLLTFSMSGMLAAIGGILLTARLFSAQPQAGVGLELDAIAASVLGGVSLFGGVGNALSTVVGTLLVGTLGNGLLLLRVVLAVGVDMFAKRLEQR
jgi:ribose transport system permease protein